MGDNWNIEKAMSNVMQGQVGLSSKSTFNYASTPIDHATLSHCLITLAHLIKDHGDDYLPIFERLKNELSDFTHSQSLKAFAIQLAEQQPKNNLPDKNVQYFGHSLYNLENK